MTDVSSGCYIIDGEYNVVSVNETAKSTYPQIKIGEKCYKSLMGLDTPCGPCPVFHDVKGPRSYVDPIRNITESVDAVEMEIPGHGLCHGLIMSTVGKSAEYAATLPTSTEELRNLARIEALTMDYDDVFSVDLNTGEVIIYRLNNKTVSEEESESYGISYDELNEKYIRKYVVDEDKEMMAECASISYWKETLKNRSQFKIHYRVKLEGEIHYYNRKICRVGDGNTFAHVVIGVACEDEEIRMQQHISDLEQTLTEIEIDPLTGLYTNSAFILHAVEERQKADRERYDFVMLKVENIDVIRQRYGKKAYQEFLMQVAAFMKAYDSSISKCQTYLGNGTFAALTRKISDTQRKKRIKEFDNKLANAVKFKEAILKWAIYNEPSNLLSIEEIIEKTDFAIKVMPLARNKSYVEFDQRAVDRMNWEEHLEKNVEQAIAQGQIRAWYQPKFDAQTGKIQGAEALVRWFMDDGRMIPPADFINVLEIKGFIAELDKHIFRLACAMENKIINQTGCPFPISVNLSRASMLDPELADEYTRIAEEYGVPVEYLPIEITESTAIRSAEISLCINKLIEKGFILHVDDFGSGLSSMAILGSIPFKTIKLDKSLIDLIGNTKIDILLDCIISYAKKTNITLVAEGVENAYQNDFLKETGCDLIQGYFYSRPLPEEEFIKLLNK